MCFWYVSFVFEINLLLCCNEGKSLKKKQKILFIKSVIFKTASHLNSVQLNSLKNI